jgi:hypothetical protein
LSGFNQQKRGIRKAMTKGRTDEVDGHFENAFPPVRGCVMVIDIDGVFFINRATLQTLSLFHLTTSTRVFP